MCPSSSARVAADAAAVQSTDLISEMPSGPDSQQASSFVKPDPSTPSPDRSGQIGARRRWRDKFLNALRGLRTGVQGHSSFFVHFFFTALVVAAALAMGMSVVEWAILLACVSLVLMAELFNSALETLVRSLDREPARALRDTLDIAAAAVLVAALGAALIGGLLFLRRLGILFDWWT